MKHGDGVKVIALWVDDATKAWKKQQTVAQNHTWHQPLQRMRMAGLLLQASEFTEKQFISLLNAKIITGLLSPAILNGKQPTKLNPQD
jgi:hypothetical protein